MQHDKNRILHKLVERWFGKVTTQISYTVLLLYETIIICDLIWENHILWRIIILNKILTFKHSLFVYFVQEANRIWYPGRSVNAPASWIPNVVSFLYRMAEQLVLDSKHFVKIIIHTVRQRVIFPNWVTFV